jgi:enoyl-CoA hydratase/carnithine racemase
MSYETLHVDRGGAVMTVRLNRPEKRNAINNQMHLELQSVCRDLAEDFETRAVIFAGEGAAFSSGADTSEWGLPGADNELELRHQSGIGSRTSTAIEQLNQLTIAAIHGFAVGGGAVLAICCDFRVASESTWFSIPEVELGIPLSWHALPRLVRELGPSRALEVTALCERFSASQAKDWGFVTHLVPDGAEMTESRRLAERTAAMPALPVAMTKAMIKALKRGSEIGETAYSDPDLLLYSRLVQQRSRRRQRDS